MIHAVRPHAVTDPGRSVGLEVVEYDLDNGLHVILHHDDRLPIVAVNLWYHVGSKNEHAGESGFAHLFEHMMFQGSANVPANMHFQHVQSAGGTLNASTSFDRTNYYETLPAHQYRLGLWLEADRMQSLAVSAATLENQRSVVMEERRSRYDNQPYGTMYMELFARAYDRQSYRWPVIGSMEDIASATLEQVREFHRMYYRPDNASLCLAGDFSQGDARTHIERYFAPLENPEGSPYRPDVVEEARQEQRRDTVYDDVPLPGLIMGMHIPSMRDADLPALELLSSMLTSGRSSRLYNGMVYRDRIAQSVGSHAYELELPGLFVIRSVAAPGHTPGEVEAAIWSVLHDVRENGVSPEELERAQHRAEASVLRSLGGLQSRANLLNSSHVLMGDTLHINSHIDRMRAVDAGDIQRVAQRWLVEANSTVLHWLPKPEENEHAA